MRHDELPLRDTDFAAVRRVVMERIRHRPSRAPWVALTFASVLIVVLGGVRMLPEVSLPATPPPQRVVALVAPLPQVPELNLSGGQTPPPVLTAAPKKRQARAPVVHHRVRMHIQTADPDIRIIWIASQEGP